MVTMYIQEWKAMWMDALEQEDIYFLPNQYFINGIHTKDGSK